MENKKLRRCDRDKKIFGVCSGLGEYFNIDPVFFRIIFLVAFITASLGLWIYLIFALAMPKASNENVGGEDYVQVKRLYKSKNKVFFGVCGGLAEYFDFDVAIMRIFLGISAFFGIGIIFYIICALIMPVQP